MGFTIDMVNGEVLEESSTQVTENAHFNEYPTEISGFGITEQLVSVIEPEIDRFTDNVMPESVSQTDIDSFLDQFS